MGVMGSPPGRGSMDKMCSRIGGIGAIDLVELCLFIYASSSKPNAMAEFDLKGA
jgi:hypothetical protein